MVYLIYQQLCWKDKWMYYVMTWVTNCCIALFLFQPWCCKLNDVEKRDFKLAVKTDFSVFLWNLEVYIFKCRLFLKDVTIAFLQQATWPRNTVIIMSYSFGPCFRASVICVWLDSTWCLLFRFNWFRTWMLNCS